MSSANRTMRATLQIVAAFAFSGSTGCASMISRFADPSLERQFPGASASTSAKAEEEHYETPIPHQYQAYRPTLQAQRREFNHVATSLEVFDAIRLTLDGLTPGGSGSKTVTSTSDKLCDNNPAFVTGMGWWGASTLQPVSVGAAVTRSQCRTAFRDHFLRYPLAITRWPLDDR